MPLPVKRGATIEPLRIRHLVAVPTSFEGRDAWSFGVPGFPAMGTAYWDGNRRAAVAVMEQDATVDEDDIQALAEILRTLVARPMRRSA